LKHNFRWGFIYNDLDQCDTALVYLKKAYKVSPHYTGLEFELIFAYNALKNYDEAISIINSALQNDPKNVMFYRELGYAYLQKKEYDKCFTSYKQGIEMCTDKQTETKSEMAINMANAYKDVGNMDEYKNWGTRAKGWATPNSNLYKFIVSQGF
jgi:tetratricopeptide (TPR) repeat protein